MWSGACGLAAAARSIGLPRVVPDVGAAFDVELNVHGAPDHGARLRRLALRIVPPAKRLADG